MKVFITKRIGLNYEGVVLGRKTSDPKFEEKVILDPFVGCALVIPESYSPEEYEKIQEAIIGTVLEIKDDTYQNKDGVYLPGELDLI